MEGNQWLYKLNDQVVGPVSEAEIKELLSTNRIGPQTLISKQGSESWYPLQDEPIFTHSDIDDKAPEIREKELDFGAIGGEKELALDKPHPWHRFWARILDYMIFGFVLANIAGAFMPVHMIFPPALSLTVIFLWTFVEAGLICSWQSTIGKWLFNIKVEKKDGSQISYLEALSRSFSVWWLGLAAGLPIIYIITLIVACVKLNSNRITTWDKRGKFVIKHGKLSWWRILVIVVLFVLLGYILTIVNVAFVEYSRSVVSKIWV